LVACMIGEETSLPGCLSFVVAIDPADANAVWVTEVWTDQAAHQASLSIPAVKASIERAMPLIAGMSNRNELEPVGGIGLANP
jgi:quinol monooxygenase YgiN